MTARTIVRIPLAIAALGLAACAESVTSPAANAVVQPAGVVTGGPDESDFRNFVGQVYACVDASVPAANFGFLWKIVDNTTGMVIARGEKRPVSVGQCVLLASVPTNVTGRYTATVREDLGGPAKYVLKSVAARYGQNLPQLPAARGDREPRRATRLEPDFQRLRRGVRVSALRNQMGDVRCGM